MTVKDSSGQPVDSAAIYYEMSGVEMQKVLYTGSPVFLEDVGSKLGIRVEHQTLGLHDAGIELGEGKWYVDIILTGDDILTKVRPTTTGTAPVGHGIRGVVAGSANGANDCGSATPIGDGAFAFDSTGATTDGLPDALCLAFGNDDIANDIWYRYTASCDGNVTIDTCSDPALDTRIAAYADGACPTGGGIIVCNDDSCALQSSITFPVTSGTSYLVRVGSFSAADTGTGTLTVSCSDGGGGGGGCPDATFCQDPDLATGFTSNDVGSIFTVADNFSAAADGDITDVCFWGVAFDGFGDCSGIITDDFTITYYNDDGNGVCPGTVKAGPFNVTASRTVTGNIILGVFSELQWAASHAPVSVTAGECTWIEIKNGDATCFFAWESSVAGDGRNCQTDITLGTGSSTGSDQAFCLNIDFGTNNCEIQGPNNDLCADAEAIAGEGTFSYDNTGAGTDGVAHTVCDFFVDGGQTDNDIWYCWTAPCTGDVRFETCGLTATDSKLNVYDGCGTATDANLIACNDDDCGFQSGLTFGAVSGNTYKLRVGNFPGEVPGAGAFSLTCVSLPDNDDCANAIAVAVPSTTSGTTNFATIDSAPFCGTGVTSPGVWYSVTGTGNTITASTCSFATYDTKLSVYCGDCSDEANLTCVVGIDDFCGLQSEVSFCSQSGSEYLVLVHGFGGQSGNFDLTLSDDGQGCTGAVECQTVGACCTGADLEVCVEVTAADCASLGGAYQGDGTNCGGYSVSACANAFQDISGTGTNLILPDDGGEVVPIGFDFDFFGVTQNSIAVTSNGYLTFGPTLGDFTETNIPDSTEPNDIICPLWADFSPNIGGTVQYETQGPAGNRVFIAQWTDVPEFDTTNSNTFQALLFEADNSIEFRYGAIVPGGTGIDDGTVGIENASGTTGTQFSDGVANGDCVRFDLEAACPPPECHLVFAQGSGNDTFNQGGHTWNTQLSDVTATYTVWLDDTPQFQIPPFNNFPARWQNVYQNVRGFMMVDAPYQTYSVQVVMWNPEIFPANPEQYTDVMNVTVYLSGRVEVTRSGTADNMVLTHEVVQTPEGYKYLRFPFTINGF